MSVHWRACATRRRMLGVRRLGHVGGGDGDESRTPEAVPSGTPHGVRTRAAPSVHNLTRMWAFVTLSLAETDGRGKTRCWRQRALGCGLPRRPLAHVARIPALARLSARPRCRRPAAAGQLTYKSYDAQSSRSLPARRAAPACVTALSLSAPRALACGSYTSLSRAHTIGTHTTCAPALPLPPPSRPGRATVLCSVLKFGPVPTPPGVVWKVSPRGAGAFTKSFDSRSPRAARRAARARTRRSPPRGRALAAGRRCA
jgi:hypothetical protein